MIPRMEGSPPPPTVEQYAEFFASLERTFPHGGASPKPKSEPEAELPPELTPEELQQRLGELFGDMPLRPKPTPAPRRPDPSTPEELQQRLNEAFGGAVRNAWPRQTAARAAPEALTGRNSTAIERSLRSLGVDEVAILRPVRLAAVFDPCSGRASLRPGDRRAVSAATRGSRTCSGSARTASGLLAAAFAKAGRWRTGVAGCMAALRRVRGPQRARRALSPRWSRDGASGLNGGRRKGRNSLRVASAGRDG